MKKLKIIVSGVIAAISYQGGGTWAVLQFLLGLRDLGHDVYFVEQLREDGRPTSKSFEDSDNAVYFRQTMSEYQLDGTSALFAEGSRRSVGLSYDQVRHVAQRADILLNLSGVLTDEVCAEIPIRVYVDLDPAFTQLWYEVENLDLHFSGHTHFVTVGLGMGKPSCDAPTCGLDWITTLQPLVLSYWPRANGVSYDALTTIANWRGYGSIQHNGVLYGQKAHSLRRFMNLPHSTREEFILALAIHPNEHRDLQSLHENRWRLIDPATVSSTPAQYQRFIQASKAEFGIAKSGYVLSHSGWFSDRSVCYLASGRPVIAQETGFSKFLPTGEGLFAFQTQDDVLASIESMRSDYARHSRAARGIAEEYFDSKKVLSRLLRQVGAAV